MLREYKKKCRHCGEIVTFLHGEKPVCCPHCGYSDYIKPETETELFLLQKEFLTNRDPNILGQMYQILYPYVRSKIKKILNGVVIYSEDDLEIKSRETCRMLMEYYLTKPDFYIQVSFMGYLQKQAKSVLYGKSEREEEEHDSLNRIIDESSTKELGDVINISPVIQNSLTHDYVFDEHKTIDLRKGIMNIIENIRHEILWNYNSYYSILTLVGLYHCFTGKSPDFKEAFFTEYGRAELKEFVDKSLIVIRSFIKGE